MSRDFILFCRSTFVCFRENDFITCYNACFVIERTRNVRIWKVMVYVSITLSLNRFYETIEFMAIDSANLMDLKCLWKSSEIIFD